MDDYRGTRSPSPIFTNRPRHRRDRRMARPPGRGQNAYDRGKADAEGERIALTERIQARDQTIAAQGAKLQQFEAHVKEAQATETGLRTKLAQYATTLDQERKQAQEKLDVVNQAQQKLADAFKALAADALKGNNQSFLELAKATLETFQEAAKGDLDKRQQAILELVKPVKESLDKVDTKINELEKARAGAYMGLTEQVKSLMDTQKQLQSETGNLVKALRRPQVRGRWGEIQLKRVVEMAGMLDHCDFYEQQSTDTEDGRLRPDLLVRLPGTKNIVVDAKAPLSAYLDAIEAKDDETRTARLRPMPGRYGTASRPGAEILLRAVHPGPGVRRPFPARRGLFQCRPGIRSRIDRDGRRAECHHRHAHDADRLAASRGLWLAAGEAGRECQGNQRFGQGALQAAGEHG